jgi:hypothetical protein
MVALFIEIGMAEIFSRCNEAVDLTLLREHYVPFE